MNGFRHAALALLLIAFVPPAHAEYSKLDPRVRIALDQLHSGASLSRLRATSAAVSETGELDVFIVGSATREELEAAGARVRTQAGEVFTADLPPGAVDAVAALPGVRAVCGAVPVRPALDVSVPSTNADALRGAAPDFTGLNGAGVLVGAVDDGVDYHHGDFDDPAGNTRIVNIWDQTDNVLPRPAGYTYGTEWTRADIDANVARQSDPDAHGAAVLGVAAGDGSATGGPVPAFTYVGMAPKADLVMVKYKLDGSFNTRVVDGVKYIFQRAAARGQNAVVNLSIGNAYYGPHDGSSPWEAGLSALSGPGRIVVVAAGNERGRAMHAEVFAAGAGTDATMDLGGATGSYSTVSIDGFYNSTENLNVSVLTAGGGLVGPVLIGRRNAAYPGQLTADGYVYVENGMYRTSRGDREVYIEISALLAAAPRTWTYRFTPVALGAANGEVDLWCWPDDGSTAVFVAGLQENEELVGEPANADSVIAVAAWTSKRYWTDCSGNLSSFATSVDPGNLSEFSSPGPTRDGRQKPDLAAPGSAIGTALSQDFNPACDFYARLPDGLQHNMWRGTSFSAPHVAGAVALILQKYGAVSPSFVKQFLAGRAVVDGFTGAVWNKDWGHGKLWLGDMLDPAVTVVAPNGGECLITTRPVSLLWTATDNVGVTSVDVLLSRNGTGGPFEILASGVPNSGSMDWTASMPASDECYLKVVAHDGAGNVGADLSDRAFAILDIATPTLLSEFAAAPVEQGIELRWRFSQPERFGAVTVERAAASGGPWAEAAVVRREEAGTSLALDRNVEAGATYWYRLRTTSGAAPFTFGPIEATAGETVGEFALARPMPNPTSAAARMDFAVPHEARLDLSLFDLQGRRIATLVEGVFPAGRHQATWDGVVDGHPASAGIYFVRLRSAGVDLIRRLAVAR